MSQVRNITAHLKLEPKDTAQFVYKISTNSWSIYVGPTKFLLCQGPGWSRAFGEQLAKSINASRPTDEGRRPDPDRLPEAPAEGSRPPNA